VTAVTGMRFHEENVCGNCFGPLQGGDTGLALECFCGAQEALAELVELKRMKDADGSTPEYERRKRIAWEVAFKVCGVIGTPKP
jgi:hypothetical protein